MECLQVSKEERTDNEDEDDLHTHQNLELSRILCLGDKGWMDGWMMMGTHGCNYINCGSSVVSM